VSTRTQARLEAVRDAIRARGLRATPARIAVLDTLRTAGMPLSLADVVRRLARNEHDRATIFRNLATLTRARLVRRVDPGDRIWRFVSDDDGSPWRADFVCTACGTIQTLEQVTLAVEMCGAPRAIVKREIELHIHGRCDHCT
jgi:Fur family ferric uptake transcriptional regulator